MKSNTITATPQGTFSDTLYIGIEDRDLAVLFTTSVQACAIAALNNRREATPELNAAIAHLLVCSQLVMDKLLTEA
jgi:hypothetical protein